MVDICKLCRNRKELIKAHAIPAWAFRYLYPDKDSKKYPLILIDKDCEIKRPIGSYDNSILCSECDNFLGKYDVYGKQILLDGNLENYSNSDAAYCIKNVDIDKLRLFLVSILWRASESKLKDFDKIFLGPYNHKIQQGLKGVKDGKIDQVYFSEFDIIVTRFDQGELPSDVVNRNIQLPYMEKIGGINVGTIYLPRGIKIHIKFDQRQFSADLKKIVISGAENTLLIPRIGEYSNSAEFRAMLEII